MAVHEISVTLRSDPSPYEDAIKRMSKATSEWELSTAAGADDVDEKFADVIRALVDMERQGGRTEADVKRALQGIGLSAEDAEDAVKAIDKELDAVGKNDGGKKAADDLGEIKGGTLYPLLARLETRELVTIEWRTGEGGPGRKYFRLTDAGRAELADARTAWSTFERAVDAHLELDRAPSRP